MKKHTHIYSPLGDYAPEHSSTPIWKLALKEVAVYTLLVIGFVGVGEIILATVEFLAQ